MYSVTEDRTLVFVKDRRKLFRSVVSPLLVHQSLIPTGTRLTGVSGLPSFLDSFSPPGRWDFLGLGRLFVDSNPRLGLPGSLLWDRVRL